MKKTVLLLLSITILVSCEKNRLNEKPVTDFGTRILKEYFVLSMGFDRLENAWIGTFKQGVIKYNGAKTMVFNSSNSIIQDDWVINDIAIDSKGNVWIASQGLIKYDGEKFILYNSENTPIPEDYISCIEIDSRDNIWFTSCRFKQGGIVKYDGKNWTVFTPENSLLPDNFVQSIAIDVSDNIWLAVANHVNDTFLARISGDQWSFVTSEDLGFTPYYWGSIGINSKNEVCAAIDYSLSSLMRNDRTQVLIYDGNTCEKLQYDSIHNVRSLTVDKQDNIWCVTGTGYAVYNGQEWFSDNTSFRDHGVFVIEQAMDDKIWIGTGEGIFIND